MACVDHCRPHVLGKHDLQTDEKNNIFKVNLHPSKTYYCAKDTRKNICAHVG